MKVKAFLTRKGTALMVVVVFSMVITAFSFTLLDTSLLDFRKINRLDEEVALKALSDGAVEIVLLQLLENPPRLDPVLTPKSTQGKGFATVESLPQNQFRILAWAEPNHPTKSYTKKQWEWTVQIQNTRVIVLNRKILTTR